MKLVVSTSSSDENYGGGCSYAFLDLTRDTARHLLKRYEQFMVFREETDAYEVYWFDQQVEFFNVFPDLGSDETGPSPEESDEMSKRVQGVKSDWTKMPSSFRIPDSMVARSECNQVIAGEGGIGFFCYPKHSIVQITTSYVPEDMLRRAAGRK